MLPKAPTDNLYKFGCILGLTMVTLPVYFWQLKEDAFELAWEEAVLLGAEGQSSVTKNMSQRTRAVADLFPLASDTEDEANAKVQKLDALLEELHKDNMRQLAILDKVQRANVRVIVTQRAAHRWMWIACIAGVAGTIVCFWGGWRWYRRAQVHQDQILEREATKR